MLTTEHSDKWQVMRLPVIAEGEDPVGRKAGEALCPQRFDLQALAQIKRAVGEAVWESVYLQNPGLAGGATLYTHFREGNIDAAVTLNDKLPLCAAIDFNLNPGCHLELGQYDRATDRFWSLYEVHSLRMTVEMMMDAFLRLLTELKIPPERVVEIYGDATGGTGSINDGRTAYNLITARMRHAGRRYSLRVPRANPPVKSSVDAVNDALHDMDGVRRWKIHPRCERLLEDFRRVEPDEDGGPAKDDRTLTHPSDAVRYWADRVRPVGSGTRQKQDARFLV